MTDLGRIGMGGHVWTGHHGSGVVDMISSHWFGSDMRRWVVTDGDWMGCVWMDSMHGWEARMTGLT